MAKKLYPPFNEKYVRFTLHGSKDNFLHIYGAGIVFPDARYEFSKEQDSYLFEYIVSGSGYIECSGVYSEVSEGDCIAIRKGSFIHYGADKKTPYSKLWFSAMGRYPESLFSSFFSEDKEFIVKKLNAYPIFERVMGELEGDGKDDVGLLTHSMLEIMLALTDRITLPEGGEQSRAKQMKQYIDTFTLENIDVKRVAEHLGITERGAVKAFRDEYGVTPTRYIRGRRLENARKMLEETDKTVSEIANVLHFCDQSYFSTEFKREFGVYPSEYRSAKRTERKRGGV